MSAFKLEQEQEIGSIKAKLYSYTGKESELNSYIKNKVQQQRSDFADLLDTYGGAGLDKKKLLGQYSALSTPQNHQVPAFDIKRSTVTEFMAEFLLEKEFQCIFFEKINKKIKKSIIDTDRHTTGVDVVGIQEKEEHLKFVMAEVKASGDQSIPCASARSLQEDIDKAMDFKNDRLYREIFAMFEIARDPEAQITKKYVTFLLDLIAKKDASEQLIQRIIIFPFLIRNHSPILENKNLNDYQNFSELDTKGAEIIGIIWAINKDIDQFASSIYNNA